MAADKDAGRLSKLRRYAHLPSDVELIQEMMASGLSDQQIAHALGHSDSFSRDHLPDGHGFRDALPTDQEEAAEAEMAQQANVPSEATEKTPQAGESEEESDPLIHMMGLLNHIVKNKSKNKP